MQDEHVLPQRLSQRAMLFAQFADLLIFVEVVLNDRAYPGSLIALAHADGVPDVLRTQREPRILSAGGLPLSISVRGLSWDPRTPHCTVERIPLGSGPLHPAACLTATSASCRGLTKSIQG